MSSNPIELAKRLIAWRYEHPAWQILAARRAPLVIGCLKPLLDQAGEGLAIDDAQQRLAEMLREFANDPEFDVNDDAVSQARRELRGWTTRGLLVERAGRYGNPPEK